MSRKDPRDKEKHVLFMNSGGVCAFPKCGKKLVENPTPQDDAAIIGEIAHIVAGSRQGPRGNEPLEEAEREKHPNLILLCRDHHKIVDSQVNTYSVAVLRQMKNDHEGWVDKALRKASATSPVQLKHEKIQSTLLSVTHLPQAVFSAPCGFNSQEREEVKQRIIYPARKEGDPYEIAPFYLRDDRLYAFQDLKHPNPFSSVIDSSKVIRYRSTELWEDPDWKRLYIALLNGSLYKHTGRLQVRFLPEHKRFYFPVLEEGVERSVTYRSPNREEQNRQVAWEPKFKHSGEGKGYWFHLAARLYFHQMDDKQWFLSIRPERHLTKDGTTELPPETIGRRVTKIKAKMYNDAYFNEIVFWRDFLSQGQPRFVFDYGSQKAIIDVQLVTFDVDWVGIEDDDKPFKNEVYPEDLFTLADRDESLTGEELDWEEWQEADEAVQDDEVEIPI
ncbi:MAG: hypothetical protein AABN95_03345 [Acidobacteriota bacterium]